MRPLLHVPSFPHENQKSAYEMHAATRASDPTNHEAHKSRFGIRLSQNGKMANDDDDDHDEMIEDDDDDDDRRGREDSRLKYRPPPISAAPIE